MKTDNNTGYRAWLCLAIHTLTLVTIHSPRPNLHIFTVFQEGRTVPQISRGLAYDSTNAREIRGTGELTVENWLSRKIDRAKLTAGKLTVEENWPQKKFFNSTCKPVNVTQKIPQRGRLTHLPKKICHKHRHRHEVKSIVELESVREVVRIHFVLNQTTAGLPRHVYLLQRFCTSLISTPTAKQKGIFLTRKAATCICKICWTWIVAPIRKFPRISHFDEQKNWSTYLDSLRSCRLGKKLPSWKILVVKFRTVLQKHDRTLLALQVPILDDVKFINNYQSVNGSRVYIVHVITWNFLIFLIKKISLPRSKPFIDGQFSATVNFPRSIFSRLISRGQFSWTRN